MPYIKGQIRPEFDSPVDELVDKLLAHSIHPHNHLNVAGDLNYIFTTLILKYFKYRHGKLSYWMSPLIRGILQDVGTEFYNRVMVDYEIKKRIENGDIPEYNTEAWCNGV